MSEHFHIRNRYILSLDLLLIALAAVLSFVLRLELNQIWLDYRLTVLWMVLAALVIKPLVYRRFRLYQRFWAYASAREALIITMAVTTTGLLLTVVMYIFLVTGLIARLPRSVLVIDWLLSLLAIGGVRFLPRFIAEGLREQRGGTDLKQVLVVGAGDAGALVVRELQKNLQLKLAPVGFLDDDDDKQNYEIYGVPVLGTLDDLADELDARPIDEVIIAIPSAPGSIVRQVAEVCRQKQTPFRTMPGIYELLGGTVSVNRLRPVSITDLLRRELTPIDNQRVGLSLGGKRVLITGAGGSIASELCRQIARWMPSELVLVGHGENSIFEIMVELGNSFPALTVHPLIADVRHANRINQIFSRYRPQVIFHAAAHKHVPLMEKNVEEAITNNILGTRNVVELAIANEVERLVMISTDKAVNPTSIMGATKRMAEMIVLDAANRSDRPFSVVRFGNVLGSRGSVVPMFRRQIAQGGPLTVTHQDIERFFMTIPEAVHLVLQAFAMGQGAEVFVLDMGQPVRIMDLAEDLIRLSGLEPGQDIEIVVTGLRPGEKLFEELWDADSVYHPTDHPEITRLGDEGLLSGTALSERLDELIALADDAEVEALIKILDETIPGAKIRMTPPPDMTAIL